MELAQWPIGKWGARIDHEVECLKTPALPWRFSSTTEPLRRHLGQHAADRSAERGVPFWATPS